jgi:hypothetical protein
LDQRVAPSPATLFRQSAFPEVPFMLVPSVYEAPKIVASFEADEILAEAETQSSTTWDHRHNWGW